MNRITTVVITCLFLMSASSDVTAQQAAASGLNTDEQKLGYVIGMDIGKSLRQQGAEVDLDALIDAIYSTYRNEELLMTPEETAAIREEYVQKRQAAQQAESTVSRQADLVEGQTPASDQAVKGSGTKATKYTIKHETKQMGEATSDKALVYFLRPAFLPWRKYTWNFADDQFIGVTDAKNYTYALVSPGKHQFWSTSDYWSSIVLTVEAGKTYYIIQWMAVYSSGAYGPEDWKVYLKEAKEEKLEKYFKKCTYVTPTEEAHTKAQEYIEERYARARAKE